MTRERQETAEFLRSLGRPAEAIAINSQLPLAVVELWLKTDKWPSVDRQKFFTFDAGASPREMTQPATTLKGSHGLSLFSRSPGGNPVSTHATPAGGAP